MKITARNLIQSWNALSGIMLANEDQPQFAAQVKRVQLQIRNEIIYWNELTPAQRQAIGEDTLDVQVQPITAQPAVYANDQIEPLNRLMAEPLPKRKSQMQQLIENQKSEEE